MQVGLAVRVAAEPAEDEGAAEAAPQDAAARRAVVSRSLPARWLRPM